MLAAEHPSANRTTRIPYTTVTLPPDSKLTVKVAASPTQLLQILYPTEMMPKGPIVFSNSCSMPRLARLACVVEGWTTSRDMSWRRVLGIEKLTSCLCVNPCSYQ